MERVVDDGKAKKFRRDGMGFDVVELGEDRDKEVEVRAVIGGTLYQSHPPPKQRRWDERHGGRGRVWRFRGSRER